MKSSSLLSILCALTAGAFIQLPSTASAQAVDAGEAARSMLEKYKGTMVVVSVKGLLKASGGGKSLPDQPQLRRTLGTVVAENGMVVVSNAAIDASVGLTGKKAKNGEEVVTIEGVKTEFEAAEVAYGDGTAIKARVIRQDADADVAFLLPDPADAKAKGKESFTMIDLKDFASSAKVGDEVVGLSRASEVYGYIATVIVGRITGVFNPPGTGDRTYYITTAGTAQGIPIFTLDGKLVGVTLERIVQGERTGILVPLPASSLSIMANLALESAKQTPTAPSPAAPATGAPATGKGNP
ncbi:MAG: hypothetical protein R3F31_03830 [Verrucomicrobiales bacterium]